MGYQLSRPAVAAAVVAAVLGAACGGGDREAEQPEVLENARALVTTPTSLAVVETDGGAPGGSAADGSVGDTNPEPEELPAPDPSTFVGQNRLINLWVGPDGETVEVDVWGRRTFTNGPLLLASAVSFGETTEYFSAPPGYSLAVVGAGAGPDGAELAGLFNAADGEQSTTIFTNSDANGSAIAPVIWETGTDQAPAPPPDGEALIVLRTANTSAYTDELTATVGGDSFYVGDGSAECRTQRVEADGFQANVLGGTQSVELAVAPGTHLITLHPWFSPDECDQAAALSIDVDVDAGGTVMVFVYTTDGESVDVLVVPVG